MQDAALALAVVAIWAALWLAIQARAWCVGWALCGAHGALALVAARDLVGDALWWLALDVAGLWLVMKPRNDGDADG